MIKWFIGNKYFKVDITKPSKEKISKIKMKVERVEKIKMRKIEK